MGDAFEKLAAAGLDIAIMALICVSLFSGQPAFETAKVAADCPPATARSP